MELLEYQAKKLFREVGIPVLPSQSISEPRQLKQLQLPYPVVLKSQVCAPGRGKAGGIRFVENTIDAIAAARTIFNLAIMGEYPEVVLAEARYNTQAEFFVGIVLDYHLRRPVLLGSVKGGINVETLLANLQQVVVSDEFSPFYARRLAVKMGLEGNLLLAVSQIVERMYSLFEDKDLDSIEINPLGISAEGEVMALDGKISINDYGLARHPDIKALIESRQNPPTIPDIIRLDAFEPKGNVAIIANSVALALATGDLIAQEKGKLACSLIIGSSWSNKQPSSLQLALQLANALDQIRGMNGIKVILINILVNHETSVNLAQVIAEYLQEKPLIKPDKSSKNSPEVQLVIRLVAENQELIKQVLTLNSLHCNENLEAAVAKTISLAKGK